MSRQVAAGVRKNFVVGSSGAKDELAPSPKFCFRERTVFFFLMCLFLIILTCNTAR